MPGGHRGASAAGGKGRGYLLTSQRGVFAAASLGMLLFGVTLTTLGAVLPPLIARYGLEKADAGSLLAMMSLGILAGSLVFGPVVDRYGYQPVLMTERSEWGSVSRR